jgi:hypothetical protein
LQWDLPAGTQADLVRVEFGQPGAFMLRALRIDGVAIEGLVDRIASSSVRTMQRRDGAVGVASAHNGAWVEFDIRTRQADTPPCGRVEIELQRESGAAELAALITSAVGDALDARDAHPMPPA